MYPDPSEPPTAPLSRWLPGCADEACHLQGGPAARCCAGLTAHAPTVCGSQAFTRWPTGYSWDGWPKCPVCLRRARRAVTLP